MSFSKKNRQKNLDELIRGTNRHNSKERRAEIIKGLKALGALLVLVILSSTFMLAGGILTHYLLFGYWGF